MKSAKEYMEKHIENSKQFKAYTVIYYDFETFQMPVEGKGKTLQVPYQCCCSTADGKEVATFNASLNNIDVAVEFLRWAFDVAYKRHDKDLCRSMDFGVYWAPRVMLCAHNAAFDVTFLRQHIRRSNICFRGTRMLRGSAGKRGFNNKFYPHEYPGDKRVMYCEFVCTYAHLQMPLRNFGSSFGLAENKQEIMPYSLYKMETLFGNKNGLLTFDEIRDYYKKQQDDRAEDMLKLAHENHCIVNGKLDLWMYSAYYCERDVEVLRLGFEQFRKDCLDELKLDIRALWTSASLADTYMKVNGVYEGCYEIANAPQQFIQKCCVGGRVMTNSNLKWCHSGMYFEDFDAVSLYPSSMKRLKGFVKGKPTRIPSSMLRRYSLFVEDEQFSPFTDFFIKIRIVGEPGIKLQFPLMSFIDEETETRTFTNDMEDQILYVDRCQLQDLVRFQKIQFHIIDGVYFSDGRNEKLYDVITHLFQMRLKRKKEKKPSQIVYKNIMNSSYGKLLQRPIETEDHVVEKSQLRQFMAKNAYRMKEARCYSDTEEAVVTLMKPINMHFNRCHLGCAVLSMSKRIMNEVICLAESMNLHVGYTDTDSIQIVSSHLKRLIPKYTELYQRELVGKQMGQFHCDYEIVMEDGTKAENVVASRVVFAGKKSYCAALRGTDPRSGEMVKGWHIRMKGIPTRTILNYTMTNNINDILQLYLQLCEGPVEFDLCACDGLQMKFHHMAIEVLQEYKRTVDFSQTAWGKWKVKNILKPCIEVFNEREKRLKKIS